MSLDKIVECKSVEEAFDFFPCLENEYKKSKFGHEDDPAMQRINAFWKALEPLISKFKQEKLPVERHDRIWAMDTWWHKRYHLASRKSEQLRAALRNKLVLASIDADNYDMMLNLVERFPFWNVHHSVFIKQMLQSTTWNWKLTYVNAWSPIIVVALLRWAKEHEHWPYPPYVMIDFAFHSIDRKNQTIFYSVSTMTIWDQSNLSGPPLMTLYFRQGNVFKFESKTHVWEEFSDGNGNVQRKDEPAFRKQFLGEKENYDEIVAECEYQILQFLEDKNEIE